MRRDQVVEIIDRQPGLNPTHPRRGIKIEQSMTSCGHIDDECFVDALTRETRAAAARKDRDLILGANPHDARDLIDAVGNDDTDRRNLIDRRIRRVQPARVRIRSHFDPEIAQLRHKLILQLQHEMIQDSVID
jgi:hypothetical protein